MVLLQPLSNTIGIGLISGSCFGIKMGKKHRDDGPAQVIFSDDHSTDLKSCVDTEIWYKNGRIHREDGPAIIYYCKGISYDYFFFNGKPLSKEKWWNSISEQMKEKVIFSGNFH